MSAFVKAKTQFKDRAALVEALQAMGYKVEVHEQPVVMNEWHDRPTENFATVIVRRAELERVDDLLSNDLGWSRDSDGTYTGTVDHHWTRMGKLKQLYATKLLSKTARMQGYNVTEVNLGGKTKLVLRRA